MRTTPLALLTVAAWMLAFVSASPPLSAQQSPPSSAPLASDPQAIAIIQRTLAALTGSASVSDVTLTGTARRIAGSDDETGTATLTATASGASRLSLNFPSGPRSEIRNPAGSPPPGAPAGATAPFGAWSGADGVMHGMAAHNLMTDATWFFPAFTVGKLASSANCVVSYVGQETHDGQQALHLSASQQFLQSGSNHSMSQAEFLMQQLGQVDLYLDPTTLLPLALAFNIHPDGDAFANIPTEIQFSDYRAVNGVRMPFHVQRYLNNGLVLDLQVGSATLNAGLAAASFQAQ